MQHPSSSLERIGRTIASWMRVRPGPEPRASRERVRTSPPSRMPEGPLRVIEMLAEDVQAVLEHDPAARHALEVILVYPGLHALWTHRLAHALWKKGLVLAPRVIAHMNRMVTGIEIHPAARFGRRVFIDHGMGIVVGETATVGDECLLYKGVVLGGTSTERKERHPTLGRGVVVGTNACVLGPIQVGDGAKVGSNSVVIRDVPAGATVVGVPGKVVTARDRGTRAELDHADLPDPVANVLSRLVDELERLERRVLELEGGETEPALAGRAHELADFEDEPT